MAPSSNTHSGSPTVVTARTNITEDMTRSSSTEPSKSAKRKGTRSVSTLTPSQLARKRANDREAQRAIRARTKEHIERLERELEELKSQRSGDEKYQELLRTNKALQKEIRTLRESMGLPHNSQYPPVENLSMPNSEVPSRASSYGHSAPTDYKQPQEYGAPYLSTPEPSDSWAGTIPVSVPASNGSSPSSSGPIEEYNGYIPTSVAPAPAMMEAVGMPPANVPYSQEAKYEEVDGHDNGLPRSNPVPPPSMPQGYHFQQQWGNLYPVYYPQSPAM